MDSSDKRILPPKEKIFDASDLSLFRRSEGYEKLHKIIRTLVCSVKGKDVPPGYLHESLVTKGPSGNTRRQILKPPGNGKGTLEIGWSNVSLEILSMLKDLDHLIDETPPITGPRRFGNMACRDWHNKVKEYLDLYVFDKGFSEEVRVELRYYLGESFGSKVRLDYGSGHELNFVAFLGALLEQKKCLNELPGDEVLAIFACYYDLARRLIIDYSLEPAGSHGVWGLDDHFHFIYILGAAQFNVTQKGDVCHYIPSVLTVLDPPTLDLCKTTNLYVNSIAFIMRIKTGPFNEHSPVINDIHRSVSLWSKVLSGLLKMYEVEVFGKFPVVQHFYFGNKLYLWTDFQSHQPLPSGKQPVQEDSESGSSVDTLPGMINGLHGTNTTMQNISLTGAPWAMNIRPTGPSSRAVRPLTQLLRARQEPTTLPKTRLTFSKGD